MRGVCTSTDFFHVRLPAIRGADEELQDCRIRSGPKKMLDPGCWDEQKLTNRLKSFKWFVTSPQKMIAATQEMIAATP